MQQLKENIIELPTLRDKPNVFADRLHAGGVLGGMLASYRDSAAIIFGIVAGGLPVAAAIQARTGLDLDVLVVSKITLPWNTEAGYGAVAFDGTVRLNHDLIARLGLTQKQIREGSETALRKVERRLKMLRGERPFPDLRRRSVIVVDDGLASGYTMTTAIESLIHTGAATIAVAVPTGHLNSVRSVAALADQVYCANIRGGLSFAVADAYEQWSDVQEHELLEIVNKLP